MTLHASKELPFHMHIVDQLVAQGWQLGESAHYDRTTALYTQDVLTWLEKTEEKKLKTLRRQRGARAEAYVLEQLQRALESPTIGTLNVLRNGFTVPGAGSLLMSVRAPQSEESVTASVKYQDTIYRVVPELSYSPFNANELDIALFINGLPVATLEVKSNYTQHVNAAVEQYKTDRRPDIRGTHKEPLLTIGRGALVHFAVSQDDVQMCTKLAGPQSYFLPFNRGNEGGRGNGPYPGSIYPSAHLWLDVLRTDTLMHIVHQMMLYTTKTEGRRTSASMIFPRFHQLDAVRSLIEASKHEGPGHRYLIQHSAGSGKSKSIVWTALALTQLQRKSASGATLENVFDSVLIVTDRTVLDDQLSEELAQLKLDPALVESIERGGSDSKSKKLADALIGGKRILTVTLQTFPTAREIIHANATLRDRNFAVIIDEAHSSTSGTTALSLRDALTGEADEEFQRLSVDEQLLALQSGRGLPSNISFYAFTATPKAQTIGMFGRAPKDVAPDQDPLPPAPFHVYTMQQAIEEGFILDVLRNYVSYATVSRITLEGEEYDQLVRGRVAKRELTKWRNLHPTNIHAKIKIILDHFQRNVVSKQLLGGRAKAMIVTSSRAAAVAYHLALERTIKENLRIYPNIRSLVAFSEEVSNLDVQDDAFTSEYKFSETNLNPLKRGQSIPDAFDDENYNVLIVASKYQTGFDQPKLVAMYVDKPLSGVEAVQTLSRLNRTYPNKEETFILDFVNKDEEILRAFQTYYKDARIDAPQDLAVVYALQEAIYQQGLFTRFDVDNFKNSFEQGAPTEEGIASYIAPKRVAYNEQLRELNDQINARERRLAKVHAAKSPGLENQLQIEIRKLGEQRTVLEDLKRNLQRFGRLYTYTTQLLDLNDPDIEAFYIFSVLLAKSIDNPPHEKLNLEGLVLEHYGIRHAGELHGVHASEEDITMRNPTGEVRVGRHDEKTLLSELLVQLADEIGESVENITAVVNHTSSSVAQDETVVAQILRNTNEQMLEGSFPEAARHGFAAGYTAYANIITQLFEKPELLNLATMAVLENVRVGVEARK